MDRARKAEPFGNAATYSREKSRNLINHFNRISHVSARVDSTAPAQRMAGFSTSSVEQKILRLQEIEAENRRLLHKISAISTSGTNMQKSEFRWDKLRGQKKRLNEGVRRREHERIWKENQLIMKRLQKSKPTVGRGDWKSSEKWNKNFLAGADRRRAMLRLDNIKIPDLTLKKGKKKRSKAGKSRSDSTPSLRPTTQASRRSSKKTPGSRPTTTASSTRSRILKPVVSDTQLELPSSIERPQTNLGTRSTPLPDLNQVSVAETTYEETFEDESPTNAVKVKQHDDFGILPSSEEESKFVVKTFEGDEAEKQEPSYVEDFEAESPKKNDLQEASYAEDFEADSPKKNEAVESSSYAEDFEADSPTKGDI